MGIFCGMRREPCSRPGAGEEYPKDLFVNSIKSVTFQSTVTINITVKLTTA
jgi:hypothetical protein